MIKDKVKKTIIDNGLIEQHEHIVIGLSGGPDSVCLFHVLYLLKDELHIELDAVHINHGLRPGAADRDQEYVEELCKAYNVACSTFSFDVNRIAKEEGISGEDAGRRVRYESFYKVAKKIAEGQGKSVKIAVAQNMNDQAETVLMRIIRGTGIDGLGGIEYSRKEKESAIIIRPLLDVSRDEIEEYCNMHNLEPRIDLTNLEPIYTRNKIRLELIPYLKDNFNTGIVASINRLSKIAREDKDYLYKKVDEIITQHGSTNKKQDKISIPLRILNEEHPAIRHRAIMKTFERIGLTQDITAVHLEQADKLIKAGRTSSIAEFTKGYVIEISYGMAEFYQRTKNEIPDFEYEIKIDSINEFTEVIKLVELNAEIRVKKLGRKDLPDKIENVTGSKNNTCYLNLDKIMECKINPAIRIRRSGDYIKPFGMKGRKKIQDFFVDEKIAKDMRYKTPLLCIGSEVIWVIGSRISENYKIQQDTEQIILLEYLKKV